LYFKTAGWEEDWIKTAREMVCDIFKQSYKQEAHNSEEEGPTLAISSTALKVYAYCSPWNNADIFRQISSGPKNVFDNLPSLSTPTQKELQNKLDWYFSTDPERINDVLAWWYKHWAI
jgi:hypothetical protein